MRSRVLIINKKRSIVQGPYGRYRRDKYTKIVSDLNNLLYNEVKDLFHADEDTVFMAKTSVSYITKREQKNFYCPFVMTVSGQLVYSRFVRHWSD